MPDHPKTAWRRLLFGAMGLVAALLSVAAPLSVFWNEANETEGLRRAGLLGAPTILNMVGVLALGSLPALLLAFLAYKLLKFSLKGQAENLRWISGPSAILIGALSGWMLYATLKRDYWDYYLYPKLKALDGYSYPQHRYAIFDALVLVWCLDGIMACVLLLRTSIAHRAIDGSGCRTTLAFVVGFDLLLIGYAYGVCLRSMGF
jgi:hypothetical protein